MFFLSATASR
jgi:hypothetical protein